MRRRFILVGLGLVPSALAFAHPSGPGPHKGEVQDASPGPTLHFEVVLKGSVISVYLANEDGSQVPTAGLTGSATILVNKKKEQVDLVPAGGNLLTGTATLAPGADMRMLVVVTVAGVKQQALFTRFGL